MGFPRSLSPVVVAGCRPMDRLGRRPAVEAVVGVVALSVSALAEGEVGFESVVPGLEAWWVRVPL